MKHSTFPLVFLLYSATCQKKRRKVISCCHNIALLYLSFNTNIKVRKWWKTLYYIIYTFLLLLFFLQTITHIFSVCMYGFTCVCMCAYVHRWLHLHFCQHHNEHELKIVHKKESIILTLDTPVSWRCYKPKFTGIKQTPCWKKCMIFRAKHKAWCRISRERTPTPTNCKTQVWKHSAWWQLFCRDIVAVHFYLHYILAVKTKFLYFDKTGQRAVIYAN